MTAKQAVNARYRDCLAGSRECTFADCALKGLAEKEGRCDRTEAIRKYCQWCMNGHPVNQCASPDCAIYQYRANATGNTYDQAREREQGADTDTRQAFCAGMVEAYKDALAILSGAKEEA